MCTLTRMCAAWSEAQGDLRMRAVRESLRDSVEIQRQPPMKSVRGRSESYCRNGGCGDGSWEK
jgi:hypothetical protein